MATEYVGGVEFSVDADTKGAVNSVKQVGVATEKVEKNLTKLDTKVSKTAKSVNNGIGSMGRKAGQAGIQMQQFIGQIQGGQNAMLALSAQSADLGFVLGAPLLGAIAGISASIVGLLLPSLFDSTTEAEKLEKALEALEKMTYEASDGTIKLSESIEKLAGKSAQAAKVELALGIVKAKEAIVAASKEINEASTEWESFFTMTGAQSAIKQLDNLAAAAERTGETQAEVLERLGDSYEGGLAGIGLLSKAVDELGDEYGLTAKQSLGFFKALKDFEKTKSPEAMQGLSVVLSDIALSADKPNAKLLNMAKRINTASVSASNAKDVMTLFESALADLGKALDDSGESNTKLRTKVDAMVSSLDNEAKKLKETNRETAIRIATENKATKAQLASINASFDKIEAIEAEEKKKKAQSKADKLAKKEQIDDEKKYLALLRQARANAFKKMDEERQKIEDEAKTKKQEKDVAIKYTEDIVSRGTGTDEAREMEKAKLDEYLKAELIDAKQHEDALTQIKREGEAARYAAMNLGLSSASSLFGEMANLVGTFGSEQSAAYKAMFALSKGFAVAQAGLNLSMALSNASAVTPWYSSLAAMSQVATAGAGFASSIASASYSGREHGGSVIGGQTYEMGEKNKPEMLVIPGNNGQVFSNAEMKSMMGSGGGGYQAPTVNNYAAGSGVSVEHSRDQLSGKDVFDIVQGELANPNSRGRRNLANTSNISNKTRGSRF